MHQENEILKETRVLTPQKSDSYVHKLCKSDKVGKNTCEPSMCSVLIGELHVVNQMQSNSQLL